MGNRVSLKIVLGNDGKKGFVKGRVGVLPLPPLSSMYDLLVPSLTPIVVDFIDSDMVQTKQYMSGHVEAEVKFPLDTSNLGDTSVSIEFVVFEYAYVFRRMQEGRATRNLFREVKKLRSGAKKTAKILKVGVYTFPFKFYVNKTLPSSFRHRTGNEEVKVEVRSIVISLKR